MKSIQTFSLMALFFASSSGLANDQVSNIMPLSDADTKYFEVASVEIDDVTDEFGVCRTQAENDELLPLQAVETIGELAVQVDQIVLLGSKIWSLVEAGKPVVSTKWQTASALPQGITNWDQMAGWKMPESRSYRIKFVNLYGMNVINFVYRLNYTYGGSYKGQGRYLNSVSVMSESLAVSWGFNFDGSVEIQSVANGGTAENPVALMELIVKWKSQTPVRSVEGSAAYVISGEGEFKAL